MASAQGQKIWTITQDNLGVALAAINLDADSETEIRNGVNAGMVVTTHEQSINFNGWVGEGYIILDPATGAGAYKIAGGGNGGLLSFIGFAITFIMFTAIILGGALAFTAAGAFTAFWAGVGFYLWIKGMENAKNEKDFNSNNLIAVLGMLIGLLGIAKYGAEGLGILIFSEAIVFFLGSDVL